MSNRNKMFFVDAGVLDYTGAVALYSLRNVFGTWTKAVLKIRRTSDNGTAYVFFDGTTITLSSFISTSSNTTPSATTLTTWVGANDAYVEEWYSQFSNNTIGHLVTQTTTTLQPKFITSGAIITENGKPSIDFLSDKRDLLGSAISAINTGNNVSFLSVTSNKISNSDSIYFSTKYDISVNTQRILLLNDNRTSFFRNIAVLASGGTVLANNLTEHNITSQKILFGVITSLKGVRSYYNSTKQEAKNYTGTYQNDDFLLGNSHNAEISSFLKGHMQEFIVWGSDQRNNIYKIHQDVNSYYSIY